MSAPRGVVRSVCLWLATSGTLSSCAVLNPHPVPAFEPNRTVRFGEPVEIRAYGRPSIQQVTTSRGRVVQAIPLVLQRNNRVKWADLPSTIGAPELTRSGTSAFAMRFFLVARFSHVVEDTTSVRSPQYIFPIADTTVIRSEDLPWALEEARRRTPFLAYDEAVREWSAAEIGTLPVVGVQRVAKDGAILDVLEIPRDARVEIRGGLVEGDGVSRAWLVDSDSVQVLGNWWKTTDASAWAVRTAWSFPNASSTFEVLDPGSLNEIAAVHREDWTTLSAIQDSTLNTLDHIDHRYSPVLLICSRLDGDRCFEPGRRYGLSFDSPDAPDAMFPFYVERRNAVLSLVVGVAAILAFLGWSAG